MSYRTKRYSGRAPKEHPQYKRVAETPEELEAYKAKNDGRRPVVYRVECRSCGKRIWGSGMGIGSHNRACPGDPAEERCVECGGKFRPEHEEQDACPECIEEHKRDAAERKAEDRHDWRMGLGRGPRE